MSLFSSIKTKDEGFNTLANECATLHENLDNICTMHDKIHRLSEAEKWSDLANCFESFAILENNNDMRVFSECLKVFGNAMDLKVRFTQQCLTTHSNTNYKCTEQK
jgi:hypothetical protein